MPFGLIISPGKSSSFPENKFKSGYCFVYLKILGFIFLLLSAAANVFAQKQQPLAFDSLRNDSVANKILYSIKKFGAEEQKRNINEYNDDIVATRQDQTMDELRKLTLEAKSYLENGLDTTGLSREIYKIEHWYDITIDGVFKNTGSMQTHRNLETSFKVMRELLTRMLTRKSSLDDYYKNLVNYRNHIDSLYKDSALYIFSSDSIVLNRYLAKLTVLSQEIKPIDSSFKQTIINVSELQPTVNRLVNLLNTSLERITLYQQDLSKKTFTRETSNLGGTVRYTRQFSDIVDFSMTKGILAFIFFVRNEIAKIILLLLFVIALTFLLRTLKRKLHSKDLLNVNLLEQSVLKYPLLSSIVIVFNIIQFIFIDPPFVFISLLWTISAIALTIIFKSYVSRFWMMAWLSMFILFLLACLDNTLVLQASRTDRWIMFSLSLAGVITASTILAMGHRYELREKLVVYFLGLVVAMQLFSILTNLYGRFNLSKTCLASGFFSVILIVLFFWCLRFIVQSLALASKAYHTSGKKIFNFDLEKRNGKAPPVFYVILFVGWFILFARNFYAYRLIADPIENFITQKRTFGEFSFTIGSIFEFFLIIYLAGLISKIVAFFAADRSVNPNEETDNGGMGSWSLIIRISVITIGFLLAFAAVGIPMDKLTIILSALSVGVGFGLQSLVNNLVSGLIISVEKPVNIGDMVEIGDQAGTIQSIGFRSSILSTPHGSEVVIPNGELLNQHLINWTHNNHYRCAEIPVSVAYGTNLEKAIQVLKDLPTKDERILDNPGPGVSVKQFTPNSIDMVVSFWVKNLREFGSVRSDMILSIDKAFRENDIKIPFPQQDVHIRSVATDGTVKKNEVEEKSPINGPKS